MSLPIGKNGNPQNRTKDMYYDDALIAAYMQREFGVKLRAISSAGYIMGMINFEKVAVGEDYGETYHIHPDSLSVFEPMENDLVEFDGICSGFVIAVLDETVGIQNDDVVYEIEKEDCVIIQRNGKPFFMPKQD